MDLPSVCLALYRRLASAYPHEFRMLYGEDMDRLGEDAIPEVWRRYGVRGVVRLLADIAIRLRRCAVCFGQPASQPSVLLRQRRAERTSNPGSFHRTNWLELLRHPGRPSAQRAGVRTARAAEREHGAPVPAILNQTAALGLFGSENPVGHRIREGEARYTVVGLARDGPPPFLRSKPVATMFLPFAPAVVRKNPTQGITVLLRGAAGQDVLAAVQGELASHHPGLTVFNARTLEGDLNDRSLFIEWQSTIFVILGVFALLLACIGLGGVTAYTGARRHKEIGIRMALGARDSQILRLVLREGAALVAVGLTLGFGGAFSLWRILTAYSDMLARTFDRPVSGPLLMIGAPLVLASLTMLACYLPARRATRIEPVAALRQE